MTDGRQMELCLEIEREVPSCAGEMEQDIEVKAARKKRRQRESEASERRSAQAAVPGRCLCDAYGFSGSGALAAAQSLPLLDFLLLSALILPS